MKIEEVKKRNEELEKKNKEQIKRLKKLEKEHLQLLHQKYNDPDKAKEEFNRFDKKITLNAIKENWNSICSHGWSIEQMRDFLKGHGVSLKEIE